MNPSLRLAQRTFPSRIADLGFTAQLPTDWISHNLPTEEIDFSDPTRLVPLAIVTAPHAAIVFAFAARPAYDDGTLHDWAWHLIQHHQLTPRAIGSHTIGTLPAVVGEATQSSDLGPMIVRFAFLEDGGRLVNITFTAPELLADSVRDAWFALLNSFTLATPRGSRFAAAPDTATETSASTPAPEPPPEPPTPPAPAPPTAPAERPEKVKFSTLALADTEASLEANHPIYSQLREQGAGLVLNVVATDSQSKFAIVASDSIRAQFRVPFGWHAIDDGQRVLVFDPKNQIQIHLHLLERSGRSNQAIFDDLQAEAKSQRPNPEFTRTQEGRIEILQIRDDAGIEQPSERCHHLLLPPRRKDVVLCASTTATSADRRSDARKLALLLLKSMDFNAYPDPEPPASEANAPQTEKARRKALVRALHTENAQPLPPQQDSGSAEVTPAPPAPSRKYSTPAWWNRARELEAANDLNAAEQMIFDNVPHLGCAASVAELYRLRMNRLKSEGDEPGSLAAFQKADHFIWMYASGATSGGEGAALSLQRDEFRDQLVREFGRDPAEDNAS